MVKGLQRGGCFPWRGSPVHISSRSATLSDLLDLSELFGDFRDEGRAQLALLDDALIALEAGDAPDEARRAELLRALHTLKGNAAMLGLRPMQELVHGVEDAFKRAPAPARLPLEALQRTASALRGALEAAGSPGQDDAFASLPALRAELADALAAPPPAAAPPQTSVGTAEGVDAETDDFSAGQVTSASGAGGPAASDAAGRPIGAGSSASSGSAEAAGSSASAGSTEATGATGSTASSGSTDLPGSNESGGSTGSTDPSASAASNEADGSAGSSGSTAGSASSSAIGESARSAAGEADDAGAALPPIASVKDADGPERAAGAPVAAAAESASPEIAPRAGTRTDAGVREESLRIPFARLDPLLSQVDDLARAVEGLRAWMAERGEALQAAGLRRGLGERLEELDTAASAVRRSATALRLVPVERVFSRFPPLAATLARERGKRVRVELRGEGTELDKATADALLDPLLHLVRNAVDHGVETPAERRAAGKPETGTVVLSATQEGDRVRIEVEDDGRGLDRARIAARGRELGLVAPEEPLEAEEVDDLLFRPGFSTRTQADEVSGRGVGLDVVRDAVARLRGQVHVEDGDEGGTRFVLLVPLTVALVPVLFFQAGGETFAIPALDVEETVRAAAPGHTGPAETVAVRDEAVPLVRLDRVFGWTPAPDPRFVLVLRRGVRAAAVGADRLLAQDAAAVRALPAALGGPRGVSGAVVDARGRVVLLLDPGQLMEMNVDLYRGGPGGG